MQNFLTPKNVILAGATLAAVILFFKAEDSLTQDVKVGGAVLTGAGLAWVLLAIF